MRVFLSYAFQDRALAEPIYLALRAQRHNVFFDRADLPPGEEYNVRIRRAIGRSHLFVFLVSPDSLDAGSYTLTELGIAQKIWDHPGGRLLPVVLRPVGLDLLPPYLKSVTLLEPEGNVTATVADGFYMDKYEITVSRYAKFLQWRIGTLRVLRAATFATQRDPIAARKKSYEGAAGTTRRTG